MDPWCTRDRTGEASERSPPTKATCVLSDRQTGIRSIQSSLLAFLLPDIAGR